MRAELVRAERCGLGKTVRPATACASTRVLASVYAPACAAPAPNLTARPGHREGREGPRPVDRTPNRKRKVVDI